MCLQKAGCKNRQGTTLLPGRLGVKLQANRSRKTTYCVCNFFSPTDLEKPPAAYVIIQKIGCTHREAIALLLRIDAERGVAQVLDDILVDCDLCELQGK